MRKNLPDEFVKNMWRPGQSGNPNGRPKGSKGKLTEAFVLAMHDDFVEHGQQAIAMVREEKPDQYLRVIASMVPKEMTLDQGDTSIERLLADMPDEQFFEVIDGLRTIASLAEARSDETAAASQANATGLH